ncbi:hypothetical protein AGMMS49942_27020 [Spirochaetia bacterium]|nr:hypothetical protein AGMMS49942_27020 [Spirochaetia bacterium]
MRYGGQICPLTLMARNPASAAMELLDLMPNPTKGCLVGVHGDEYLNELD